MYSSVGAMKMQLDYSPVTPPSRERMSPPQDNRAMLGFTRRQGYTPRPMSMVTPVSPPEAPPVQKRTLKQIINNSASTDMYDEKPMAWGEPTWFLFHTLAHKIKQDKFVELRKSLLDVIYTISVNLPCPTCAEHAKRYLEGINFQTIQSKETLKSVLFDFHNTVNVQKGFPVFPFAELDAKYQTAITKNILQNFMNYFEKKSKSIRLIADDWHRKRVVSILKSWFTNNLEWFDV